MAKWEVWLYDAVGVRLAVLDEIISLSAARGANRLGAFTLQLPGDRIDHNYFKYDGIVNVLRAPTGGSLGHIFTGIIRAKRYAHLEGVEIVEILGPDAMDKLAARVVAYAAGSSQAVKTDLADDMLKDIIYDNLMGGCTDGDRQVDYLGLSKAPDLGAGPSITKEFSWRDLYPVLQEIAAASSEAGTNLYFDMVPIFLSPSDMDLQFRTYIGQLGQDRSESYNRILFSADWGNLRNPELIEDRRTEKTVIYAGGQAEGASREMVEVEDTTRAGLSVWNRREGFLDASGEETTAGATDAGEAELNLNRPLYKFSCELLDTPQARFGIDWNYGDIVTCSHMGQQFSGMVEAVKFDLYPDGSEQIQAKIEVIE